jgi:Fe2+ or Zn2+ uptake regulation protein
MKVLDTLQKKGSSPTDVELFYALKEQYDDLSFTAFNKTLMKLEIRGMVHVYNLTKNKRGVVLIKR